MTTAESGAEVARVARGLAYVCRHLDELRTLLNDDGTDPSAPLTELVSALQGQAPSRSSGGGQAGPSIASLLDRVHTAVQAAGDALGVYGVGVRSSGQTGMEPLQVVFRCPLRLCAGRPADRVSGPQPVCTVSPARLSLVRERLT
jgi:hypothetical protein